MLEGLNPGIAGGWFQDVNLAPSARDSQNFPDRRGWGGGPRPKEVCREPLREDRTCGYTASLPSMLQHAPKGTRYVLTREAPELKLSLVASQK